jgi:AraC family transcriptional regulator
MAGGGSSGNPEEESMPSAGFVRETQVMRQEEPGGGDPIGPPDWLKLVPFQPAAASARRGWVGLEAAHFHETPAIEFNQPGNTHHMLVLFARPPEELHLLYEGMERHVPPPAGSISLIPAGSPAQVRTSGCKDQSHIFLEPGLVARVAAEAFDLDPARATVPPFYGLDLPHLRVAMRAVDAELSAAGAGGRLAAESLANVLAVHLIRHVLAPRRLAPGRDGALPRGRLRAVVEYIEEHLDAGPSLEQMAAVARLSVYHFSRQFKSATGLPPHQYVIMRRVERAKQLLQGGDFSLAQVAARAGFTDQSQFAQHFKRQVGVTPGQFRRPARFA